MKTSLTWKDNLCKDIYVSCLSLIKTHWFRFEMLLRITVELIFQDDLRKAYHVFIPDHMKRIYDMKEHEKHIEEKKTSQVILSCLCMSFFSSKENTTHVDGWCLYCCYCLCMCVLQIIESLVLVSWAKLVFSYR